MHRVFFQELIQNIQIPNCMIHILDLLHWFLIKIIPQAL